MFKINYRFEVKVTEKGNCDVNLDIGLTNNDATNAVWFGYWLRRELDNIQNPDGFIMIWPSFGLSGKSSVGLEGTSGVNVAIALAIIVRQEIEKRKGAEVTS